MGGLFVGFFTPTEAGAVGAFSTLAIAVFRKQIDWRGFVTALRETTRITCMILVIVTGATVFGHFLAVTRIPFEIAGWIAGFDLPPWMIMMFIILTYLVGGCLIDSLALIMLTVPIFFPVVLHLGFDPIWFGVVIVLITQIGVITPPWASMSTSSAAWPGTSPWMSFSGAWSRCSSPWSSGHCSLSRFPGSPFIFPV